MQVIMHKATDGSLHESFEAFAKREAEIKVKTAIEAVELDTSLFFVNEDAGSDEKVLAEGQLNDFIVANADTLRKVLEASKVVKRGRGPSKKTKPEAAQATA